jgi:hypothetical protein
VFDQKGGLKTKRILIPSPTTTDAIVANLAQHDKILKIFRKSPIASIRGIIPQELLSQSPLTDSRNSYLLPKNLGNPFLNNESSNLSYF